MGRMLMDVAVGESITIGKSTVTPEYKSGSKVRLRVEAPEEVEVILARRLPGKGKPQ